MKSLLGFDYLLTPRVLVFFYWIVMLFILLGGIYSMFTEHLIAGFFGMLCMPDRHPRDVRADHGRV
ncbi:hypothetical protein LEADMM068B1_01485 [Leclercia adecarboxylata]|uniref:hypothetical protein n=1 Tax=Leclercia adecarboxylata TaxID=83655 RepID=UPI002E134FAD